MASMSEGPGVDRAVVFQHASLLPWRTIIGNIRYGNEPLMLWSACPGMAKADWIAETLQWMIHPQVDRVQRS